MSAQRRHVLLVEADTSQQEHVMNLLLARGVRVSTAPDAQKALRLMENGLLPDMILCNLDVPDLRALRFVQAVRARKDWVTIPIILTSAHDDPTLLRRALSLGVDDYLQKPMDDERLLLTIYNRARRTQELTRYAEAAYDMLSHIRKDMARMFTHELRTPLVSLNMVVEMLTRYADTLSAEDRREMMETLQGGVMRLNRLVEQMVLLVQLDAGELQQFIEEAARPGPLWDGLTAAVSLARNFSYRQRDVDVIYDRGEVSGMIMAEWRSLRHALAELLSNAMAFSPPDQPILVKQWLLDDEIYLRITDSGPGIPWQDQRELFRRFHQVEREKHDQQGIGMGLYLARNIIEASGGKMNLISGVGEGTTVAISFPIIKDVQEAINRTTGPLNPPAAL